MFVQTSTDHGLCVCQVWSGSHASRWPTGQGTELTVGGQQVAGRIHCTECGVWFKGKRQLIEHCRARHGGKRLACPQCLCTFVSTSGLKEHIKHIHEKLARYQCEQCGKGFSIRSNYYDHLAAHSGSRRNTCTICQKQFIYRHSLKTHVLRFHPSEAAQM